MAFCSYYNLLSKKIVAYDWYDQEYIIIFGIFGDKFTNFILFHLKTKK